jgi:hypothetical protein
MTDLLDELVAAHGGLGRWNGLETVSAHLAQGGVTWELVGQKGVPGLAARRSAGSEVAFPVCNRC